MTVPEFEFTDRAVPIVQMGRFQRLYRGTARWGTTAQPRALWGTSKWARGPGILYQPVWQDVTCDVHEVTTNTGGTSATDRFQPGTAEIIASNVTGWGDGVVVNWAQMVDDFERTGPEMGSYWEPWAEMAALRPGMDPLVIEEIDPLLSDLTPRAATVQQHPTYTRRSVTPPVTLRSTHQRDGSGATLTIGPFPDAEADDVIWMSLVMERLGAGSGDAPPLPLGGWTVVESQNFGVTNRPDVAAWSFYLFRHRVTEEEEATGLAWTYPSMTGRWNYTAWIVSGSGSPEGIYTQHAFGSATTNSGTFTFASLGKVPTDAIVARIILSRPPVTLGALSAPLVNIAETSNAPNWNMRQFLAFDGGIPTPTLYAGGATVPAVDVPWTEAAGVTLTGFHWCSVMILSGTSYAPLSLPYEGASGNKWAVPYVGDHFIETTVSGLRAPQRVWPDAGFLVELYVHLDYDSLASQVASFEWVPDWDAPGDTGRLSWWLHRREADGSWLAGAPFAAGHIDFGAEGFPELALFRFEADSDGELRLFFQGSLITTAVDTEVAGDPLFPLGQHVAIYSDYHTGSLSYGRTIQPGPTRFEQMAAGAHEANPIHLEPGALIRIGVHHQRYGFCWFFNGYCDALRPVYLPDEEDSVRIECIDAFGEAGRIMVEDRPQHSEDPWELEATDRVAHVLDRAEWPPALRSLDDDATIQIYTLDRERVIDLLTQSAESCGGAVYGGPESGDVVFRRKDWQGWDPDLDPVDGWITNRPEEAVDFDGLVVCPSGWDRSWDREEMATRVNYNGGTMEVRNTEAERRWGIELYERELVTNYEHDMRALAYRQLRLRGPDKFPRVEAVFLDAATDTAALDMMATATFTGPHQYRCQLHRGDRFVFNQRMLVTGLRHVITRHQWTLRMALDLADPFMKIGGQWSNPGKGRGRWGVDVWSNSR